MAQKIKLTRPELKRQRDMLNRYQRYLPMLKLKQQQLQATLRDVGRKEREAEQQVREAEVDFRRYEAVLADLAGLPVRRLAEPRNIRTSTYNVAGVELPILEDVDFEKPSYSLFGTPPWVDQALTDLRELNRRKANLEIIREQYRLLERELSRIVQRVNLFEKIKIPECQEAIRVIRIKLGDEMTAGVGRAKIAKTKLQEKEQATKKSPGQVAVLDQDDEAAGEGAGS